MQDFQRNATVQDRLLMMIGTGLGGGLAVLIINQLPIAQTTLLGSLLLGSLIVVCAYLSNRVLWWMTVGAIAGIILGIAGVMAGHLAAEKEPLDLPLRLTFVGTQSLAGFLAGLILGRKVQHAHLPTLKDFLSSLSALTVGLFAVVVTARFVVEGLDPARTLSSRLSVSMTILITLLAIPGAVGYFLAERQGNRPRC
ncbi:MAG: hypothetical protein HC929_02105 [Leptolyngbyaceae cyanobacterium SM2_5_2]|nr:hypothetical protein [Leptolyngbyaceae cyanobacterium SM2_5_2]